MTYKFLRYISAYYLLLPVFFPVVVYAQPKLTQSVSIKGGQLSIPFKKYKLPNGLTVILSEDHSDPLVHVDVTYHVGSAREEVGKSGFAHFFEHMMFQGSNHVANGDHFKFITEAGGDLNGSTTLDRTNYYETVPSNQLEKMLWLESDRMAFLLDAVTQQKFEVQRSTVKNEKGQNYDNRSYGQSYEHIAKTLYPYGHPYSWLTIGYVEDLNKVGVNDLKHFFLRWYGPNNATLTIGGDLDEKKTLAWVNKYFGSIPKGPAVKNMALPAPVLPQDRYISYTDNYAKLPLLSITYPGVKAYHPDMAALDALCEILGKGRNSMFYQSLVKPRLAAQAGMHSVNNELAGEVTIQVLPYPGLNLVDAKRLVDSCLKVFERRGPSDEEVSRFKSGAEAAYIEQLSSVAGKTSVLAQAEYLTGNPDQTGRELAEIRSLTKADIMRAYNTYIKDMPAVILSVLPRTGQMLAVKPDNYVPAAKAYQAPDYRYEKLAYHKPKDNFDRSLVPPAGANPQIKLPAVWANQLPNGIRLLGNLNTEIPSVSMELSVRGGGLFAANAPAKAGLAGIVARMMNEDTQNLSAEQFSGKLSNMGSRIAVYANSDEMGVSVLSLTKNLQQTMYLLDQRLLHPHFTQEALERIKKQTIEGLRVGRTEPSSIASILFGKVLYGSDNVRTYAVSGTEATVSGITLEDVQQYYDNYFVPSLASIVVVGDISQSAALHSLAFLNNWKNRKVSLPQLPQGRPMDHTTLYFYDVPNAAQSEIRIGYLTGLTYDATGDPYKLGIANYILGGAFNSHVNLNLREKRGWTYGAGTAFTTGKNAGEFMGYASVLKGVTDSAVAEFVQEIDNYRQRGMTNDELKFTRLSMSQSDARKYETNSQKAQFLSRLLRYDLQSDYIDKQSAILASITPDQLKDLTNKYLDIHRMAILVVGDKASVLPGLKKLGYPVVELDIEGKPKS